MKLLHEYTYLLHEKEVNAHLEQDHPVIKANLYGAKLQDGPCKSVYFMLLGSSKRYFDEYDKILQGILRKYSGKTLAFSYEVINKLPIKKEMDLITLGSRH